MALDLLKDAHTHIYRSTCYFKHAHTRTVKVALLIAALNKRCGEETTRKDSWRERHETETMLVLAELLAVFIRLSY